MKHTPGPWKILEGHSHQTWFVCYHSRRNENGKVSQRAEVAKVYNEPRLITSSDGIEGDAIASCDRVGLNHSASRSEVEIEAKANARLIMAAPELLDAAEMFFKISLDVNRYSDEQYESAKTELIQAIAKAKGES